MNRLSDIRPAFFSFTSAARRWWIGLLIAAAGYGIGLQSGLGSGTWTACANLAPEPIQRMLLLSDGTVMAAGIALSFAPPNRWYRLRPDAKGSYANGTWSTLSPMHDTRMAYSSAVLRDGRVFVAGGEYGTGTATAEIYDPVTDSWGLTPPSGQSFLDSICKILGNGDVLVAPVFPNICGRTIMYHPGLNTWSAGPILLNACYQDEASWVKLADGSILTVDPFGTNTERYIPALNLWVNDAIVPVALYDSIGEIGSSVLLPDGRAFFLGGTGHTALYTPSGNVTPGSWKAGPDIPNGHGTSDAPAAMMVNGKIFCAVGPTASSSGPSSFYEYDPVANSFASVVGPTGSTDNVSPQQIALLDLPDGTVLYTDTDTQLYVYTPVGSPLAPGKPAIQSVVPNLDGSYHLTGTLLNGISEGAGFGDDLQMDSNYPLVRLLDSAGQVYYARTFNWSSTAVMTGSASESTEFTIPASLPAGTYSLVVVANGISSDAVPITVDALQLAQTGSLAAVGSVGGAFSPPSQTVTIDNSGPSPLPWSIATDVSWLSITPTSGTVAAGQSSAPLTIAITAAASTLSAGTFLAPIWITNLSSGSVDHREFTLTVSPAPGLQSYSNYLASLGPVGYWRLEETNQPSMGGIATNLGTLSTDGHGEFAGVVAWIPGPLPARTTCTSFEGISSVTVPYNTSLSLSAPFSVEAWLQPSTEQTLNVGCPLACGHFDTSRSGWLIYQTATGWNFRMYDQHQLDTSLNIEASVAPVAGTWYHVVAVYDGAQATIYVNGAGTSGTPTGFVPNTDGPFTVGTRSDAAFGFSGAIGEVAVYTNALSAGTVQTHYRTGTNASTSLSTYSQLVLNEAPLVYFHMEAPVSLPVALNSGSLGVAAQGFYQLGCVPGLTGAPLPGLGAGNRACQFNGAAGYLNVPGDSLDFTNSVSLVAWVLASPANGLRQCIVGKGDSSYRLEMDGNGFPQFANGSANPAVVSPARTDDGRWHQLVGIYDVLGTNYLYVDGKLAAVSNAPTSVPTSRFSFRMGGASDAGTARNFSGLIDEVAVFTNALTSAQVQQLFVLSTNTASAPVLQLVSHTDGSLVCIWTAIPGVYYEFQSSTNLSSPGWSSLGNAIIATNGTLSVPLTPSSSPRFFRAVQLP
jgi:hypothetical protein